MDVGSHPGENQELGGVRKQGQGSRLESLAGAPRAGSCCCTGSGVGDGRAEPGPAVRGQGLGWGVQHGGGAWLETAGRKPDPGNRRSQSQSIIEVSGSVPGRGVRAAGVIGGIPGTCEHLLMRERTHGPRSLPAVACPHMPEGHIGLYWLQRRGNEGLVVICHFLLLCTAPDAGT